MFLIDILNVILCANFTMSETANNQGAAAGDKEKPAQEIDVKFPPFPDPSEEEFEDDIGDDERNYYRNKFKDLNTVNCMRLHCSACDRHLGSSTRNDSRMRAHPLLRTLVCHTCHTFYNSGEFEKGDDGSELYCRWCGQGGQVYCCSDCPHVFCAKCIKRNLGVPKIKEIENTDDWKCFKCNPRCLWDLRSVCWALLRYCDLKNKITHKTEDSQLKEAYQKDCAVDHTDCCKYKQRRKEKPEPRSVKKEPESAKKGAVVASTIARIPSTIQVKKFASINLDESIKEKKAQKRPHSPFKPKPAVMKTPIAIAPSQKVINPMSMPPLKKIRMPVTPMKMHQEKKAIQFPPANVSYARIRPKPSNNMAIPIITTPFNGFPNSSFNNYSVINDNINLSLESLTQGLDMAAVVAMSKNNINQDDDVVCTPDFPMEPLCEVTEDNTDDDVQCITPVSAVKPNAPTPPALVTRTGNFPDLSTDNIIQMTDEDVTVNTVTGGLKFRVDPQTLSSNKMYRLPDGRIFAINANPNMPGGYSATIVAVTEAAGKQPPIVPKGATYAAKLSAVTTSVQTSTPSKSSSRSNSSGRAKPAILRQTLSSGKKSDYSSRECDLQVPVEWYRYNLIDAVDSLEYSLSRLYKLKKEATTLFLRHRSVDEMRGLHRTLERLLNTSANRFNEIRDNLNKELKQYLVKKAGGSVSDDDDDCEILPNSNENDDPIFIDENSMESTINEINSNESQEVDLTGVGSSDHNDSGENRIDSDLNDVKEATTPTNVGPDNENCNEDLDKEIENENKTDDFKDEGEKAEKDEPDVTCSDDKEVESHGEEAKDHTQTNGTTPQLDEVEQDRKSPTDNDKECTEDDKMQVDDVRPHIDDDTMHMEDNKACTDDDSKVEAESDDNTKSHDKAQPDDKEQTDDRAQSDTENTCDARDDSIVEEPPSKEDESKTADDVSILESDGKTQDSEMSEELIEKLLKDDNVDELDNILNNKAMDVVESV